MSAKKRAKPVKPAKNTKTAKKSVKAPKKSAPKTKAKKSAPVKAAPKKGKSAAKAAKKTAPKAKAKKSTAKKSAPKAGAAKKGAAKKVAAKTAPAKKPGLKKARAAKPKVTRGKADPTIVSHRDATGHLDPQYAAELHELSIESEEPSTERAFIGGTSTGVAIAEELAEEFVSAVTSGEDDQLENRNEDTEEDAGGPFVASTAGTEFAEGTDESNPESATREPFPKT